MNKTVFWAVTVLLLALCIAYVHCDDDSTLDKVTDFFKDGAKKAGDFAEKAGETISQGAKDAYKKTSETIKETYDKAADNIKKNTQSSDTPWEKIKGIFSGKKR